MTDPRPSATLILTDLELIGLDAALLTESDRLQKIADATQTTNGTLTADQTRLLAAARRCLNSNEHLRGRVAHLIDTTN